MYHFDGRESGRDCIWLNSDEGEGSEYLRDSNVRPNLIFSANFLLEARFIKISRGGKMLDIYLPIREWGN